MKLHSFQMTVQLFFVVDGFKIRRGFWLLKNAKVNFFDI